MSKKDKGRAYFIISDEQETFDDVYDFIFCNENVDWDCIEEIIDDEEDL